MDRKTYVELDFEVISFETDDVIVTSVYEGDTVGDQ